MINECPYVPRPNIPTTTSNQMIYKVKCGIFLSIYNWLVFRWGGEVRWPGGFLIMKCVWRHNDNEIFLVSTTFAACPLWLLLAMRMRTNSTEPGHRANIVKFNIYKTSPDQTAGRHCSMTRSYLWAMRFIILYFVSRKKKMKITRISNSHLALQAAFIHLVFVQENTQNQR